MVHRRWQLGWKATAGYLIAVAALIASGMTAVHQVRLARQAGERARQTTAVLHTLTELQVALLEAESGQRGYLLTGAEAYLETYNQARVDVGPLLDRLRRMFARMPEQLERIEQVASLAQAKLNEIEQTAELNRTQGWAAATNIVGTHVGRGLMTRIATTLREIELNETAQLQRRANERSRSFWMASRVALASSGIALVVVAFTALVVNGEVRRRTAVARALRESEEQLRVTLQSIGDAVIATDAAGRVVFMNPAAETLTGWPEDDARGRHLEDVFDIHDEWTGEPAENPVGRVLREGALVGLANGTVVVSREGVETPIDDSGAPIRDAGGMILGVVLVFRDITERKRQAEEHDLLVREEAARALAERESRTKDEFLAILSHELRSPLQGILGWLTVLREIRAEPAQQQRALQAIERGVRQQAQLVNDILDVSRIVAGKLQLERRPVDLAAVVEECVDHAFPEAEERGVVLRSSVGPCGTVLGDRHRLRQSVTNLVGNALKFTPAGGHIEVACRRDGDEISVVVHDSGAGIHPDFLPHIFDRFTQADERQRPTGGGLGLGLSIVRQIAEVHGGRVLAHSEGIGHGAMFELRVPAAPPEWDASAAPADGAPMPTAASLEGVSILVVDDDCETRDSLALLLATRGALVRHAGSVAEARDAWTRQTPDVVISDISMPEEDGYALIGALRENDRGRPFAVALTGYAGASDRDRSLAAGFDAHVAKPVDLEHLVATIIALIGRQRAASAPL